MDATRSRRTRDSVRRRWYSHWRSYRFARHLGFATLAGSSSRREMTVSTTPAVRTAA